MQRIAVRTQSGAVYVIDREKKLFARTEHIPGTTKYKFDSWYRYHNDVQIRIGQWLLFTSEPNENGVVELLARSTPVVRVKAI